MNFVDHGYFNFFFYFILVALFKMVMIPYDLIIFCLRRVNNTKLLIIYFGAFFTLIISVYFYLFKIKSNCSDWPKGLNNTFLENNSSKYGCQIKIPKKCTFKIFKYIQDYTKLRKFDCKIYNNKRLKANLLRNSNSSYISITSQKIGFPLTNKDPICLKGLADDDDDNNNNHLYKYVLNNLVDMDNKEILNKYFKDKMPEVLIDFSENERPKLIVNVHFNKTLSDERKLLEINSEPYSNNILLLYGFFIKS